MSAPRLVDEISNPPGHLSYSSASTWHDCPANYAAIREQPHLDTVTPAQIRGTLTHWVTETVCREAQQAGMDPGWDGQVMADLAVEAVEAFRADPGNTDDTAMFDSPIKQDRVEDLFFDWIEAVKVMRPKIAVAENVTGLTIGPARGYLIEILERLRDAGYNTKVWKLDASLFGAPTRRTRIFVVGTRLDGFPVMPVPSTPTPITAGEATADLQDDLIVRYPPMRGETDEVVWENNWAPLLRPEWAICKKAKQMRPGTSHADRFSLMRLHPDKPAPVLDTVGGPSSAGFVHWDKQLRRFSIEELARLQGFPDHYNFGHPVSYTTKVARLGNSVPPPLAAAVGTSIRNYLTANTP